MNMNISAELLSDGVLTYMVKKFNSTKFNAKYVKDDEIKQRLYFDEVMAAFKEYAKASKSRGLLCGLPYDVRRAFQSVYGGECLIEMLAFIDDFEGRYRLMALDYVIQGFSIETCRPCDIEAVVKAFESYTGISLPTTNITSNALREILKALTGNDCWWGKRHFNMILTAYFGAITGNPYRLYKTMYESGCHRLYKADGSQITMSSIIYSMANDDESRPRYYYHTGRSAYDPENSGFSAFTSEEMKTLLKGIISTFDRTRRDKFGIGYMTFTALYGTAINMGFRDDSMTELADLLLEKMKDRKLLINDTFTDELYEGYMIATHNMPPELLAADNYLSTIGDCIKRYRMIARLSK